MKKLLLILTTVLMNINFYGQTLDVISSQASQVDGGVNVNLQTHCLSVMYNLEHNYTIDGYQINLSTCYHITPLQLITSLNEDFFIPTPDSGDYIVNLTIYSSESNSICDYSTIQNNRILTLSISDFIFLNNDIKLSPNPTNGIFNIETRDQIINNIKIYNSIGKLVKTSKDLENNISNLQNGMYYIVLETEKETFHKKIILQK